MKFDTLIYFAAYERPSYKALIFFFQVLPVTRDIIYSINDITTGMMMYGHPVHQPLVSPHCT